MKVGVLKKKQMSEKEKLIQNLNITLSKLIVHKDISNFCNVNEIMLRLHDEVIKYVNTLKDLVIQKELSINYIRQFQNEINQTINFFPYHQYINANFIQEQNKDSVKNSIENQRHSLESQLKLLNFNINFFRKLNFFSSNIVAVGANGSGKTTLSNELKKYLPKTGIVISAQKVLIIPTFSGVSNFNDTSQKLQQSQSIDKSLKVTYSTENQGNSWSIMTQVGGEFKLLLDNLLAERSGIRNRYFDLLQNGQIVKDVPITKLDKAIKIWNSLIQHRIIECVDGINITLRPIDSSSAYPAHQMSDGEKVTLYLISHILQAPQSGFIIIDEPEMYLHKTILKKLWDILEQERQDCIFIYLTHDLDFATSRRAKKVWIKNFNYPNIWEIEDIPDNELPETLLLELLGSRKNILFCEGEKGSIDEKIYNILFPNFTITPVKSCFNVINYTKSFNNLPQLTTKAFGLIDSDHHGYARLKALEPENIFSYSMTEPENLFLDENFLELLAKQLLVEKEKLNEIKSDVINQLEKELTLQVANYVSSKINYYFKDSHVSKGNDLVTVTTNFSKFTNEIKILDWYNEREKEIKEIINNKDYQKTLSLFNNKGLKVLVNKHFKISDFSEKSLKLLQFEKKTHSILRRHFPIRLIEINGL